MRLYLKNLTFFLFTVSVICSCNLTGDYVLDYGNLKVYYDQEDSKKIAQNFASYWKKENYLGDRTQNIKLVLDEKKEIYQVRIILRKDFEEKEKLSFDELQILGRIQQDLNAFVFNSKPCELVICDNKFQILQTPHPLNSEK